MSRNTVLIVEPDTTSRSALRATLEGDGYTVVEAAGASAALALVNQKEITLVVTELYLASGTQRCLLPAIRSSSALRRTKVLAYTTHSAKKDRDWAIAEGADGYVLKKNGQGRLLQVAANLGRSRRRKRIKRLPEA
jgi:CheY-like chemotaxis protein